MARMRDRIFAMSGAILFFVTSIALTVMVIITSVQDSNKAKTNTATTQQSTCEDTQTEPVLPAPEVYKPDAAVPSLQIVDLEPGTGTTAKSGDCLVVKYYGTLASTGALFDESFTKPTAYAFKLGAGGVIKGWDQGLVDMKVGGTRRLVIPSSLGYGDKAQGNQIPANSDLVFVVKLLRIQQ